MGLLDRLVGDLIARETGLPVRRLVRRAGVGRLLAAGGLAAGAVAAVDWAQRQRNVPAPGPPPPPLPPLPNVALPPLPTPAAPTVGPPAEAISTPPPPVPAPAEEELPSPLRFAVLRTIVAAALADDDLAAAERAVLERHLPEAELEPAQAARLRGDLTLPATPAELAALAANPVEAEILYRFATLIVAADGAEKPSERAWLERLGDALSLPAEQRRKTEAELLDDLHGAAPGG